MLASGIGDFRWAPFASLLAFEIYKKDSDGNAAVRIVSNGKVQRVPESDPEGLVDWSIFRERYHPFL